MNQEMDVSESKNNSLSNIFLNSFEKKNALFSPLIIRNYTYIKLFIQYFA